MSARDGQRLVVSAEVMGVLGGTRQPSGEGRVGEEKVRLKQSVAGGRDGGECDGPSTCEENHTENHGKVLVNSRHKQGAIGGECQVV